MNIEPDAPITDRRDIANGIGIEWVLIDELRPHPKNRNQHSKEQIERLSELIRYQGWRHPVIISQLSGYIVAGHGRVLAAKKLGLQKVPVQRQGFLDETQEIAFLTSDNSIAAWAHLDLAGINADLTDLGPDFNVDLLGLKDFELEPFDKMPEPGPEPKKEKKQMLCPSCGYIFGGGVE